MPLSEARKKANKKWDSANMTNFSVKLRRDYAERIKAAAAAAGTTPSSIMRKALDEFMRETETE